MVKEDELINLLLENNEEVKDELFTLHKDIIDIYIKKYKKYLDFYKIDYSDVYSECLLAFNYALNNYDYDKNTTLKTFISLCINRAIIKFIRNSKTNQGLFNSSALSLQYEYGNDKLPLIDLISDEESDPYFIHLNSENKKELDKLVSSSLSSFEYLIYNYMIEGKSYNEIALLTHKSIKQVDNTIQRIRTKLKKILN